MREAIVIFLIYLKNSDGYSDQNYRFTAPNSDCLQSIKNIVCLVFACKITAGARSDIHGLVRDFSEDHTKVFKVRLRRDKKFNCTKSRQRCEIFGMFWPKSEFPPPSVDLPNKGRAKLKDMP